MPTAKHVKQPKIAPTTRPDIDASFYSKVDAALKDLRACSRQIAPVLLSMEEELRILERLFYKGKNQHRLAIFWRKVEEMRRFGKRIVEMQLPALMDDLRYAFYENGDTERNPSFLKKAWTQVPDLKYLSYMLDRVEGANILLVESRKRFVGVNKSLLLMMQTGAFLQFIVTLTAIVSRLDALAQELREPLTSWRGSLRSLISVMKGEVNEPKITMESIEVAVGKSSETVSRAEESFHDDLGEDLGSAISRRIEIFETILSTQGTVQQQQAGSSEDMVDTEISTKAIFESLEQHSKPSQVLENKQIISTKQVLRNEAANTLVKRRVEDGRPSGPKVKKKKKDAIDDIFGGL